MEIDCALFRRRGETRPRQGHFSAAAVEAAGGGPPSKRIDVGATVFLPFTAVLLPTHPGYANEISKLMNMHNFLHNLRICAECVNFTDLVLHNNYNSKIRVYIPHAICQSFPQCEDFYFYNELNLLGEQKLFQHIGNTINTNNIIRLFQVLQSFQLRPRRLLPVSVFQLTRVYNYSNAKQ